jgi:hypothetical protein
MFVEYEPDALLCGCCLNKFAAVCVCIPCDKFELSFVEVLVIVLLRIWMHVERALCHGGVASGGSDNCHAVSFMCYHKRGGREVLG